MYLHIYIYIHMYMYMYIYICMQVESLTKQVEKMIGTKATLTKLRYSLYLPYWYKRTNTDAAEAAER
jgi:hypothetical protein